MRAIVGLAILGAAIGLVGGLTLLIGLRAFPAGANHTGDGAVHVCVNNSTGAMREISNPNRCRSYEHPIELGGPVVAGYQVVTESKLIPKTSESSLDATCPPGKQVIGGGATRIGFSSSQTLTESGPTFGNTAWTARVNNSNVNHDTTLTVHAICANVAP